MEGSVIGEACAFEKRVDKAGLRERHSLALALGAGLYWLCARGEDSNLTCMAYRAAHSSGKQPRDIPPSFGRRQPHKAQADCTRLVLNFVNTLTAEVIRPRVAN